MQFAHLCKVVVVMIGVQVLIGYKKDTMQYEQDSVMYFISTRKLVDLYMYISTSLYKDCGLDITHYMHYSFSTSSLALNEYLILTGFKNKVYYQ